MRDEPKARYAVHASNLDGEALSGASVTLEYQLEPDENGAAQYGTPLDPISQDNGTTTFEGLPAGYFRLTVEAAGYESDVRIVPYGGIGGEVLVVLGQSGDFYRYVDSIRVPFVLPEKPQLLIVLDDSYTDGDLDALFTTHHLEVETSNAIDAGDPFLLVKFTQATGAAATDAAITALNASSYVATTELVMESDLNLITSLTDVITVRFDIALSVNEWLWIAGQHGMEIEETLNEHTQLVRLRHTAGAVTGLMTHTRELAESGTVVSVSNGYRFTGAALLHTDIPDHAPANPGALCYPAWHLRIIDAPKAWARLRAISGVAPGAGGDLTYGGEHFIANVNDSTIQSWTDPATNITTPSHPAFLGVVTGGAARMHRLYDFKRLEPHHDFEPVDRRNPHGTKTLSLLGARADQGEGGCGVAGNVRLIATNTAPDDDTGAERIRWTFGSPVAWTPSLWSAHFPVGKGLADLPAPLSRGADLSSNSQRWYTKGITPRNSIRGSFVYATVYGRNGRGGLMIFSAGNGTRSQGGKGTGWIVDDQVIATWDEAVAVSGSVLVFNSSDDSLREVHAEAETGSYSSVKDSAYYIDFCAPRENNGPSTFEPPEEFGGVTATIVGIPRPGEIEKVGGIKVREVDEKDRGKFTGSDGVVDTTLATTTTVIDTDLVLGSATGFTHGQTILIGSPGPNAGQTITEVLGYNRVRLQSAVGAVFPATTPVVALSKVITTMNGQTLGTSYDVNVNSTEGFLPNQKLLFGSPTSTASRTGVIDTVSTNSIRLKNPLGNTLNGVDIYFLGGPGGSTTLRTALRDEADDGDNNIWVKCTAGFWKGHGIAIDAPGADILRRAHGKTGEWEWVESGIEIHTISDDVTSPTKLSIDDPRDLDFDHAVNTVVVGGTPNYASTFGGTSMSCPIAAGVMALVLSAKMRLTPENSSLTWREARDIVRRTADKIDLLNLGITVNSVSGAGVWYNIHRQPVVRDNSGSAEVIPAVGSTTLHTAAPAAAFTLDVEDAGDFIAGHAVIIRSGGSSFAALLRAVPDRHTLYLDRVLPTTFPAGATVDTGSATITGVNGTELTLNSNQQLVEGQVLVIGSGSTVEVRYIRDIPATIGVVTNTTKIFIDRALKHAHTGHAVVGGRVAAYSHTYGRGRVNADRAVEMAIDYSHDERDLIIRNNLLDNGVSNRTPIDSPDIWVRTVNPNEDTGARPADSSVAGPHQTPVIDGDNWVWARIHNRGTRYTNLRARVRFFIAVADPTPPPGASRFSFPNDYPFADYDYVSGMPHFGSLNAFYTTMNRGSYFLGEAWVEEDTIGTAGDPTMPDSAMVAVKWPALPPNICSDDPLFLLVQVSPHDGSVEGDTPATCNNLTYRRLTFTNIHFRGSDNSELPDAIQVDSSGTPLTVPYKILARDFQQFNPAAMVLAITRTAPGVTESVTITYSGGTWNFAPALPAWITMPTRPVAGLANTADFAGDLLLTAAEAGSTIVMHAEIRDGGTVRLEKDHTIAVYKLDGVPSKADLQKAAPRSRMHCFADMAKVSNQPVEDAFGPQSENVFRLTSLFHSIDSSSVPAYAVTRGIVLVQPVDDTYVNLVLRPIDQTAFGTLRVKYFIYRGLLKKHFIGTDQTKLLTKNHSDATPFINSLYDIDEALSNALDVSTTSPLPAKVIGYDPAIARTTKIEDYFFHVDTETDPKKGYQLAMVQRGMEIGKFGAMEFGPSQKPGFGFEIVLDDGTYEEDIAYTRKRWADIDLTLIPDAQDKIAARERILRYVDPAAYFGMHYFSGVYVPGQSAAMKEDALYTAVIAKFFAKDMVYIDVRNENGCSYNYYGNYGLGTSPFANIKSGNRPLANVNGISYGEFGWPIIRYTQASITKEPANAIFLALRIDDNTLPVAYVEGGLIAMPGKRRRTIGEGDLVPGGGTTWTKDIPIVVPNRAVTGSNSALNVAGLVRVHYFRVHRAGAPVPPASVVTSGVYHDLVFGPIDATPPWAAIPAAAGGTSNPVTWDSNGDRVFVDAVVATTDPANQMGYVAERGVAREDTKVVFYAASRDHYYWPGTATPQTAALVGGTANTPAGRTSFLNVAALYLNELKLEHKEVTLTPGTTTTLLQFKERDGSGDYPASNFLALGITTTQRAALAGLDAANFSPHHPRYIIAQKVGNVVDGALTFYKYKLGVRGWGTGVNAPTQRHPMREAFLEGGSTINVYSLDGLILTSKEFGDLEAAVAPPAISYTPEEQLYLDEMLPKEIIAASPLQANLTTFDTALTNLIGAAQTYDSCKLEIEFHAGQLFTDALGMDDDRPLYWARLAMRIMMKNAGLPEITKLLRVLEDGSRGLGAAPFAGSPSASKKRILLVGFDPYKLRNGADANIQRSNPGAAAALKLAQGSFKSQSGTKDVEVHAIIMPMRYADYDEPGKERIDHRFFYDFYDEKDDEHRISAVITLAPGPNPPGITPPTACLMARFATKTRGGDEDNNGKRETDSVNLAKGDDFYETSLPLQAVLPVEGGTPIMADVYFDQTYDYTSSETGRQTFANRTLLSRKKIEDPPAAITAPNSIPTDADGKLSGGVGSAGNWLFNEVFYRLARLHDDENDDLPTGHITLPTLQTSNAGYKAGPDFPAADTAALVTKVQKMLERIADVL